MPDGLAKDLVVACNGWRVQSEFNVRWFFFLANQQTKSWCRVRLTIVVIIVSTTAVCVVIVAVAVIVIIVVVITVVGGGACGTAVTSATCAGSTTRPRASVWICVGSSDCSVRAVVGAAIDCVTATVHDERRTESVQVATVLGVVNIVLEEHPIAEAERGAVVVFRHRRQWCAFLFVTVWNPLHNTVCKRIYNGLRHTQKTHW